MNSPRELRRRIKSTSSSTAQVTKAMQMVAALKMRRAQEWAIAVRPFARMLYAIQRSVVSPASDFTHPLLDARHVRRRAVILVAADKGLCGALNTNVFNAASRFDPSTTVFITAGRRAAQFIHRTRRQLVAEFAYGDSPTLPEARAIASLARKLFTTREADEVRLVTTRFVNTLTQTPVVLEFLPIGAISALPLGGTEEHNLTPSDTADTVFEPNARAVLAYLLERYLNIYLYVALLNAKASEQSARMVAMKNATDAAETLIEGLTLAYDKLRQGNITKELLEIASGQAE